MAIFDMYGNQISSVDPIYSKLPSPGEVLIVGPAGTDTIAPGATWTSPAFNALGHRGVAFFTDIGNMDGTRKISSNMSAYTSKLNANQALYLTGTGSQTWNPVSASLSMTGIPTDIIKVSLTADSGNNASLTVLGLSLGVW